MTTYSFRRSAPHADILHRQNSDPDPAFVDHDEGTRRQFCLMLAESGYDCGTQVVWQNVFGSNLTTLGPAGR